MNIDEAPVIVEETFAVPVATAWTAITDINEMRQWYFENIPSFEAKVGFETQFDVPCGDRNFPHVWRVTAVEPLKLLRYDWRFEGYDGDSFVTFELLPQDDGTTVVRLTHKVRESFPDDIPEFKRESCEGGWTYFIKDRLKEYLATRG